MGAGCGPAACHAGYDAGRRQAREHARMGGGMLVEPALRAVAELAWKFEWRRPTSTEEERCGFVRGFVEGYRAGSIDAGGIAWDRRA